MLRDFLRQLRDLRDFFANLTSLERSGYAIVFVIFPVIIIGLINLAPIDVTAKRYVAVAAIILTLSFLAVIYSGSRNQKDDDSEENDKRDSDYTQIAPPKPDRLPTVGAITSYLDGNASNDDINRQLLAVLKSIDQSNKQDKQRREQEERESRLQQERMNELLNNKTVHYREIPGFIYFVKRGLWQIVLVWIVFCLALAVTLSVTGEVIEWGELLFLAILFLVCSWVSVRAICDWRWTQRWIIGIRIGIKQPKNVFLLLFGGDYENSIFDCGNAVVKKTKYERFLFLHTATVSVDTPRKNTDNDKSDGDPFNAMENMRRPDEYRDIVMDLHEKLTMSQSNIIKRSGQ